MASEMKKNFPATLNINGITHPVSVTITLEEKSSLDLNNLVLTAPITLFCTENVNSPFPDMYNIFVVKYGNTNKHKISNSRTPIEEVKRLQEGSPEQLTLVACCPAFATTTTYFQTMFEDKNIRDDWYNLDEKDMSELLKGVLKLRSIFSSKKEDMDRIVTELAHPDAKQLYFGEVKLCLQGSEQRNLTFLEDGSVIGYTSNVPLKYWPPDASESTSDSECVVTCMTTLPNKRMALFTNKNKIEIYNTETMKHLSSFRGEVEDIIEMKALSKDRMATLSSKGDLQIWDVLSGIQTMEIKSRFPHIIKCFSEVPDNIQINDGKTSHIITGGSDGRFKVWDIATGYFEFTSPQLKSAINYIKITNNGRVFAMSVNQLGIWDLKMAKFICIIDGDFGLRKNFALLSKKRIAFTRQKDLLIRDGDQEKLFRVSICGEVVNISHLNTLPDGRILGVINNRYVRIWDSDIFYSDFTYTNDENIKDLYILSNGNICIVGEKNKAKILY